MLSDEQRSLIETRHSGRIQGLLLGEYIHCCPVCGQIAECNTDDNFHNCSQCGSTWKTLNS